jgi:hypothetical protein
VFKRPLKEEFESNVSYGLNSKRRVGDKGEERGKNRCKINK